MELNKELYELVRQIKIEIVRELKKYIENELKIIKKQLIEKNPYMSFL